MLRKELNLTGAHLDNLDEIMSDKYLDPLDKYYPRVSVDPLRQANPIKGHNLVVIQPWISYANFGHDTDPDLQLAECVSLGNTVHNWRVIGKKVVFAHHLNKKQLLGPHSFQILKEEILSFQGVSAVFFGVELLSGVQLVTIEKELQMPVYDRFTVVLNIFRQHASTREAKIQLALAELPYIRSHLRGIHESSEFSSSSSSLKVLVGGAGERFYHRRLEILKQRESRLKRCLEDVKNQRETNRKLRKKEEFPIISVVGYTNSGKTTLIKYLTQDAELVPKDQLFATMDVTLHAGKLDSNKTVLYVDTIGFISRIPRLLIEAFSTVLEEVKQSDLILHILDVTHPDHKLQYKTVISALESLKVQKNLLQTRITVGNKVDLLGPDKKLESLPHCDLHISATTGTNVRELTEKISQQLMVNLQQESVILRVENGGEKYFWLRKYASIIECNADESDHNYLICRVIMSPSAVGRWNKRYGTGDILSDVKCLSDERTSDPFSTGSFSSAAGAA